MIPVSQAAEGTKLLSRAVWRSSMQEGDFSEMTVLQGVCPCPMRATSTAGSAPATAATMMPPGALARVLRPSTWRSPSTSF